MGITWKERFKDWQGINPIHRDLEPFVVLLQDIEQHEKVLLQ